MKSTIKSIAFAILAFVSFQSTAQRGGGAFIETMSLYNQSSSNNCETVQFMVNYTLGGLGYTQISTAISISASSSSLMTVSLPAGASVVSRKLKFNMDGWNTVIHDIGVMNVEYIAPVGYWCTTNNIDVLKMFANFYMGNHQSSGKYDSHTF